MYGLTRRMGGVDDEHVSDAERLVLYRHGFKLRYLANEIMFQPKNGLTLGQSCKYAMEIIGVQKSPQ